MKLCAFRIFSILVETIILFQLTPLFSVFDGFQPQGIDYILNKHLFVHYHLVVEPASTIDKQLLGSLAADCPILDIITRERLLTVVF